MLLQISLVAVLLLFAAHVSTAQTDVQSVLNEVFKSGTLQGMEVHGSVKMETGTKLKIEVLTSITNNGWGLESSFALKDGRCDFRDVILQAKLNIIPPKDVQEILDLLPGIGPTVKVSDIKRTVSFLPKDNNSTITPTSTTIDALLGTNPTTKAILELLGADVTFTIKNPKFMLSGISFQIFFSTSVMGPTAGVCQMVTVKTALQDQDPTLCTDTGGIEVGNMNLGLALHQWLVNAKQPATYIDSTDGTITIGSDGQLCNLQPVHFQIKGKASSLKCLGEADLCQAAIRKSLVDAVNAQLPPGYSVDASQFDNLDIQIDSATGDVTINGDIYAGAGKDPYALVQALRDYVAKGGIIKVDGDAIDTRDITDNGDCLADPDRVAAKACTPGEEPPSSSIPGGTSTSSGTPADGASPSSAINTDSGDFQPGKDDGGDVEGSHQTMLILGTVLITLAVIATIVGLVLAVKMARKHGATTHAASAHGFNQMDGGNNDGGFDSIMLSERDTQQRQAVWGDVVELRKPGQQNGMIPGQRNV